MSRSKISRIRSTDDGAAAAAATGGLSLGDRLFLRFGRVGAATVHRVALLAMLALVVVLSYLMVLFSAVSIVPNLAVLVQQGTGITLEMRLDAVVAGWLLPVLFLVAALLVAEVFLVRAMWRTARVAGRRLKKALFRLDAQVKASPSNAAGQAARPGKKARSTKIAAVS